MAKMPSTLITCNAAAISRAADAILARGPNPGKNAILGSFAHAVAGAGHDWAFIKNAPSGHFVQPGLTLDAAPKADTSPVQAEGAKTDQAHNPWVLIYDEREDWISRSPRLFATKRAALKALRDDHAHWRHDDHPLEQVMAAVDEYGEYTFNDVGMHDDDDEDEAAAYQIWLQPVEIEPDLEDDQEPALTAGAGGAGDQASDPAPEPVRKTDILVQMDPWEPTFYADMQAAKAALDEDAEEMLESGDLRRADDTLLKATIRPEAWVNDYAMEVDPEGEVTWIIYADEINLHMDDNDELKYSRNAPAWVRDWTGPFEITIQAEVPEAPEGEAPAEG